MKCENCGGNLSLEDLNCPYCGAINKHAQEHVREMKWYQGAFRRTQNDVYAATQKYAGITVRLIIIAVLLILCVVMAIVGAQSYSIRRMILEKRADRNFVEYSAVMNEYLENEEYIDFHAFVEANCIDGYDTDYEHYIPVIRASSQYAYTYEYIMGVYTEIQKGSDVNIIRDRVGFLVDQLNYFYESLDMARYEYCEGADTPKNREALERMELNVRALLQTYCGLTKEEADSLGELSQARRMVLLEDCIGYAE